MSVEQEVTRRTQDSLTDILSNPEIQSSLVKALEKLPNIMEKYDALDRMLSFANEVFKDGDSMDYLLNGIKTDLPPIHLNRDTLESAFILLDKLPKLAKYVQQMELAIDIVESFVTDKQSIEYLTNGINDIVEPWRSKIQDGVSIVKEAQQRAAKDQSTLSVFSLMKLVKDPTMQKGLHIIKEILTVIGERNVSSQNK
ncbi:hypothetical protein FY534_06505 [Alicyclobacillus sp. TC]|uniref:Uncharacterized protein YjgD (DUF1641 family) n=1 Tax=Alicyclobacillus tolerans TaxID=90970 RepID=A0ABT9LV51_9BACL|nr:MULTISPECIES: hypothetical protein [Alicyclobacillus]MDP9728127.1 uncharacterized protein YjgD (DUF1641 family) [Alicyclobacillus tengchongensis]QRF23353.1 hypothetical protein FY534_06505 [Alicyclobacillus sp. TC]